MTLTNREIKNSDKNSLSRLIGLSQDREVERFYARYTSNLESPLGKIVVVGFLRAMLNICSFSKPKVSNHAQFKPAPSSAQFYDSKLEIQHNLSGLSKYLGEESRLRLKKNLTEFGNGSSLYEALDDCTLPANASQPVNFPGNFFERMELAYDTIVKSAGKKDYDFVIDDIMELKGSSQTREDHNLEIGLNLILGDFFSHKVNIAYVLSDVFGYLLYNFHKNNFIQGLCLSTYIYEAKGVLLMLKILSEKVLGIEATIPDTLVDYTPPRDIWIRPNEVSIDETVSQKLIYLLWKTVRCNFPLLTKNRFPRYCELGPQHLPCAAHDQANNS